MRRLLRERLTSISMTRACLVILCILTLSGCAARVAYGFLDWYMEWKIGGYVTLEGEQKRSMKQAIDDFHQWHRKTQLPLYLAYLKDIQARLNEAQWTAKKVHAETDKIQDLFDLSLNKILPDAIDILHTLDEKQVKQLLDTFIDKRDEYTEKFIDPSPKKLHKKRIKNLKKELKHWIGSLTDEQETWVEQWSRDLKPYSKLFVKQQIKWETSLETYLNARADKARLDEGIRQLMFYRTDNWDPQLEAIMDENQLVSYTLLARIFNNLSEKQISKLNRRLDIYIGDLEYLVNND